MGTNGTRRQSVYHIRAFCVGTKPLLMDQYEENDIVSDLIFKEKAPPDTTTPLRERAGWTVYRDSEGKIAIPTAMILSCLCAAGCDVPLKGKKNLSKGGGRESIIPSFLEILGGEHVHLLRPDGAGATDEDWKHDVRRGTIKSGTSQAQACGVVRAKFNAWAFTLNLRVDLSKATGLTLETIRALVDNAGFSKGLGAFRKVFGRFTVAEGGWLIMTASESDYVRPKAPAQLMQLPNGAEMVELT